MRNYLELDFVAPAIILTLNWYYCCLSVYVFLRCVAVDAAMEMLLNRNLPETPGFRHAQMPSAMNLGIPQHCHPPTVLSRLETKLSSALWTEKELFFFRSSSREIRVIMVKEKATCNKMEELWLSALNIHKIYTECILFLGDHSPSFCPFWFSGFLLNFLSVSKLMSLIFQRKCAEWQTQASLSADANWHLYIKLNQVIFDPNRSKSQPYVYNTYTHRAAE